MYPGCINPAAGIKRSAMEFHVFFQRKKPQQKILVVFILDEGYYSISIKKRKHEIYLSQNAGYAG